MYCQYYVLLLQWCIVPGAWTETGEPCWSHATPHVFIFIFNLPMILCVHRYFIYNGLVRISVEDPGRSDHADPKGANTERGRLLVTLGEGCYFGDVPLLVPHQHTRSGTARAMEVSSLYVLSKSHLQDLLSAFPSTAKYMVQIAARRLARTINFKIQEFGGTKDKTLPMLPEMELDEEDLKTSFFQNRVLRHIRTKTAAKEGWAAIRRSASNGSILRAHATIKSSRNLIVRLPSFRDTVSARKAVAKSPKA